MIVIPIKPISTNKLFQGRRFKTPEYDKYIETALYLMPNQKMITGKVQLRVDFYVKNDKMSDVDNFLKGFLDCVVKKGYIEDDRFIYKLIANKHNSDYERIELRIKPFKEKTL